MTTARADNTAAHVSFWSGQVDSSVSATAIAPSVVPVRTVLHMELPLVATDPPEGLEFSPGRQEIFCCLAPTQSAGYCANYMLYWSGQLVQFVLCQGVMEMEIRPVSGKHPRTHTHQCAH